MGDKPKLLDLFCGGGGAGFGYRMAGFEVVGVDKVKRRCGYPAGEFIKANVLDVLEDSEFLARFDAIHASPPCQTHSRTKHLRDAQGKGTDKIDLIPQTREALERWGKVWVIENVEGAPIRPDLLLCGSMFPTLRVEDGTGTRWLKRHRVFEMSWVCDPPVECRHKEAGIRPLGVYGSMADDIPSGGQTCRTVEEAQRLMGIKWMGWSTLVEAIPPAYTKWIGQQMLGALDG